MNKEVLKIHGYEESDWDSDSCKSEFDEDYEKLRPPPIPYNQIEDRIVVISATGQHEKLTGRTSPSVTNSLAVLNLPVSNVHSSQYNITGHNIIQDQNVGTSTRRENFFTVHNTNTSAEITSQYIQQHRINKSRTRPENQSSRNTNNTSNSATVVSQPKIQSRDETQFKNRASHGVQQPNIKRNQRPENQSSRNTNNTSNSAVVSQPKIRSRDETQFKNRASHSVQQPNIKRYQRPENQSSYNTNQSYGASIVEHYDIRAPYTTQVKNQASNRDYIDDTEHVDEISNGDNFWKFCCCLK